MYKALLIAAACAALAACSSSEPPKKEAAAPAKQETAPEVFQVNLDTSKGPVVIEVHRDWAPIGADHFYSLVKTGFYDGDRFFRVVRDFVVQFGINGDPSVNRLWSNANLPDDPVKEHNARGTISYATAGPNTRSTQVFINLRDNSASLDSTGFAPFGKVISGLAVVDSFYNSYGDMPPQGQGPDPSQIEVQGNEYLANHFPRLDYIKKALSIQGQIRTTRPGGRQKPPAGFFVFGACAWGGRFGLPIPF
jgi:peptidyl-prolyl cis-trans isomerase A (cyclophilin A)